MARCKSCGASIVWAKTRAGKSMPLDADPVAYGNVTIVDYLNPSAVEPTPVVVVGPLSLEDTPVSTWRYQSHFSSCPDAGVHRRRR